MTHTENTKERAISDFWKMLSANQFVKSTNSITDKAEEYPPAIVDMEATVSINGEFDKYAIDEHISTMLDTYAEARVREEMQFILNVLDGIDIADRETGNLGGGTKSIRFAIASRHPLLTPKDTK